MIKKKRKSAFIKEGDYVNFLDLRHPKNQKKNVEFNERIDNHRNNQEIIFI